MQKLGIIILIVAASCFNRLAATNINHVTTMNEAKEPLYQNLESVNITERQLEAFWKKVNKKGPFPDDLDLGRCWIWTGSVKSKMGYGGFSIGKLGVDHRAIQAHRLSFFLYNGFLPRGFLVCHKCDVGGCVRGEHLFLGTNQDNMDDRNKKGRQAMGERSGKGVLTDEIVLQMHQKYSEDTSVPHYELAEQFGVSRSSVSTVLRGESWTHLSGDPRWCPTGTLGSEGKGSANGSAVLTAEQVLAIRAMRAKKSRPSQQEVARKFKISQTLVSAIERREVWSHI